MFVFFSLWADKINAANVLGNPGFETGSFAGWTIYGGNNYANSGAAHSGTYYYKVYQAFNGQVNYTGIYQDYVSSAGVTYTADGWAKTASGDVLAGQNLAWIEVTFRDPAGNILALYRSSIIGTNAIATGAFPTNTWVDLPVTNQYNPNSLIFMNGVTNLAAPPGTGFVRYQIVLQGDANNSSGSMYFDDLTVNQLSANSYGTNWNIVWSDEFNEAQLNTNNWTYDTGNGFESGGYYVSGWGNNELENYTSRTNNVFVADGFLHIHAQEENYGGQSYTSGRIKTTGLYFKEYGRFEWRASLPAGTGFWPALWMLSENSPYGGWPNSGEIDVMENNGSVSNQEGGTIHYGGAGGNDVYSTKTYTFLPGDSADNFHTYLLEWTTNAIDWFVDGHLYESQTNWWSNMGTASTTYPYPAPFNEAFYLVMNLAIGGNYLGNPNTNSINASLPGDLVVDYVRAYDVTVPLTVSAGQSNGTIVLSWPTNIVCHVQVQTNSLTGNWVDLTNAASPFTVSPSSNAAGVFLPVGVALNEAGTRK